MNLIRDTFVTKLKILERVPARWIVKERVGSHNFARLVVSTLAFDFLECIFWVCLTWFVCDESYRSLRTELVFLASPESSVNFDGLILFTLEPRFLSFAYVRAVLGIPTENKVKGGLKMPLGNMCHGMIVHYSPSCTLCQQHFDVNIVKNIKYP